MRMMSRFAAISALLATGAAPGAADEAFLRSGWFLGAGLGAVRGSDLEQEGWNRDTFCYPDAACFDEHPVPGVPGYRWRYGIELDNGPDFELSLGRFFGRFRLELALERQTNDTQQVFTGIAYGDGAPIRTRPGRMVDSNGHGSIDRRRVSSASLDAYYDFPDAWGAVSSYFGAGLGQARVEMAGVQFFTDYRDTSAVASVHEPPLAFYNSAQDVDLHDSAIVWRLHVGADYPLGRRASIGLKLTWSAMGDIEDMGGYEAHPMHTTVPEFTNTNAFRGARKGTLMLAFRRGIGD